MPTSRSVIEKYLGTYSLNGRNWKKKMFNIQQQIVTYGFNEMLVEEEAQIQTQIEELVMEEEWL